MTFGIPFGITFLTFHEKRKTHESVVPGHHESINWGTDFRGVFRVGSKTMFFEILGGSRCRSIQKSTILDPVRNVMTRRNRPQRRLGGNCFFAFFGQRRGRAKIVKVRSPGVREGRNSQKSGWGRGWFILAYARVNGTSSRGPLRLRPASRITDLDISGAKGGD